MHMRIIPINGIYQHKHRKEGRMENIKYHLSATTKITSLSCGNQKGWFTDEVNAPPKIIT